MTPEQIETVGIFSKQLETAEYLDHSDLCRIAKELLQIIESLDNWIAMGEQEPPKDTEIIGCSIHDEEKRVDLYTYKPSAEKWKSATYDPNFNHPTHWMLKPKHINDTIK